MDDPVETPASRSWYRRLLRLLPFEFRADFGDDMEADFAEQRARAGYRGRRGAARLVWDTLRDLARTAPAAHLDTLRQDARFALRAMGRNRTFTVVSVLTLGLGVGLNGAVFSLVESILLRLPPYPEAERLAMVWSASPENGWSRSMVSLQDFEALRDRARTLDGVTAWTVNSGNLTGGGEAERIAYALVSDRFFRVLGVEPARGRGFAAGEDRPGKLPVAVVSDGFWRRRLGADPAALGRPLSLDGELVTVIGVMPPDFAFPGAGPGSGLGGDAVELWRPLGLAGDDAGEGRWLLALARIRPASAPAAVEADLGAIAAGLAAERQETNEGWVFHTEPLQRALVTRLRPRLLTLWATVALVLLIACANLASLLLVRSTARQRELAVRSVLGARRLRIVRQLLTESLILALAGGAVGLLLATVAIHALPKLALAALPAGWEPRLDPSLLVFTFAVAAGAAGVSVLPAAVRASRVARGGVLGAADRGTASRSPLRTRSALVAAEVAVALIVLAAAGLLLRSLSILSRTDPGFAAENLLVLRVEPPMRLDLSGDGEEEMIRAYLAGLRGADALYDGLLARIESIPGVRRAGAVNRRPLVDGWDTRFAAEGRPPDPASDPQGNERMIMPGYFRALGVPLIAGRTLAREDDQRAPPVAVVSRTLAAATWPGESAIGRRITTDLPVGGGSAWYTVVGVVGDVRAVGIAAEPPPVIYRTVAQARGGFFQDWGMDLVVRTDGDPLAHAAAVRAAVQSTDPELPAFGIASMQALIGEEVAERRVLALLVAVLAALALALSAVGIYGVLAYSVGLRRHEMGIRLALGARRESIVRLVVGGGMTVVGGGLAIGLAASLAVGRALSGQLVGVGPGDPLTYSAVSLLLAAVALAACWLPARRAARTDPTSAFRQG